MLKIVVKSIVLLLPTVNVTVSVPALAEIYGLHKFTLISISFVFSNPARMVSDLNRRNIESPVVEALV